MAALQEANRAQPDPRWGPARQRGHAVSAPLPAMSADFELQTSYLLVLKEVAGSTGYIMNICKGVQAVQALRHLQRQARVLH